MQRLSDHAVFYVQRRCTFVATFKLHDKFKFLLKIYENAKREPLRFAF